MIQEKKVSAARFGRLRRSRVLRILLKAYIRLIKIKAGTHEIALGFAVGILISMTPTMGVQMPIAVVVAMLLRTSKFSAMLGVWLTNPFTAPIIYGFNYWLGAKILGFRTLKELALENGTDSLIEIFKKAPELLGAMTLGGLVVGIPLSIISYFIVFKAVEEYRIHLKIKLQRQKERLHNMRVRRQSAKKARAVQDKQRSLTDNDPE